MRSSFSRRRLPSSSSRSRSGRAFRSDLRQRVELLLLRHFGIDAMQLIEVDALQLQPAQASVELLAQPLRPRVLDPLARPRPVEPTLRGDDESRWIRMERLADELLADVRPVRLPGVDEVDPQLHGPPQHAPRLGRIFRRSPHALAGDAHRPEAEAVDGEIAAEIHRSASVVTTRPMRGKIVLTANSC